MKKTIGVLAHVDAGKTTFSEQILWHTGVLRKPGRVDHHDSFLDLHSIEKERGITVFADQAVFDLNGDSYTWLDTPGHSDLCAEMERVLPVLDFAVLVISCTEGVESHTETVWNLLEKHHVPVLIFINKCDRPDADPDACIDHLRAMLSGDICDARGFDGTVFPESLAESVAERDESLLDAYLSGDASDRDLLSGLVSLFTGRRIFPVLTGSALKDEGIETFLNVLSVITPTGYEEKAGQAFAARAFKVRRDDRGTRRLFIKVISGTIRVRDDIQTSSDPVRVSELCICHGNKYKPVDSASAGDIVCISGAASVKCGDGIGTLAGTYLDSDTIPLIESSVAVSEDITPPKLLEVLQTLEDEDPTLRVRVGDAGDMNIRVMGTIQLEVLQRIAFDRFNLHFSFGKPRVLFTETIKSPVIGIGHYEPLKHYAEVWLRLVPAPRGTGITFVSKCHVDSLALNWQRLIETHIFERSYPGVLIGAPLTDVCVELIAGRAHLKHTEGGDFREATCRALRMGLMNAESMILEPMITAKLRFPEDSYGRVIGDLHEMHAEILPDEQRINGTITVNAKCALRDFMDYPTEFRAVTRGRGVITTQNAGYAPARGSASIIEETGYDPMVKDTPDSVFCSHGAGHIVGWRDVPANAHCVVDSKYLQTKF